MAEEQRSKRLLEECKEEIDKLEGYALKALEAGNEGDARKFLERKTQVTTNLDSLKQSYELAANNAAQMRQMHDKLVADINELESRKNMLKAKWAVAKTQQRVNELGSSVGNAKSTASAFGRMEEKITRTLDEANAMAELNASAVKDELDD